MLESVSFPNLFLPSEFMFGIEQVTLASPRLNVNSIFGVKIYPKGKCEVRNRV